MNDNDPSKADTLDEPLVPMTESTQGVIRLYDPESTLEIGSKVATGFLILLTGGKMKDTSSASETQSSSCCGKTCSQTPKKKDDIVETMTADDKKDGDEKTETNDDTDKIAAQEELALAFASLTDGNVIDACFGINPMGGAKMEGSKYAIKAAKDAKELLREAVDVNEDIRHMAVNAYIHCLRAVVVYNDEITKLGLITFCFKAQKLKGVALKSMTESFSDLLEALQQSI